MKKQFKAILALCTACGILMACQNNDAKNKSNSASKDYIAIGKDIAEKTQQTLSKNLKESLANGDANAAISFCNVNAFQLTDSMSKVLQTKVKRVTDKPRNPKNAANSIQADIINEFKKSLAKGNTPAPVRMDEGNKTIVHYPILTNSMCMPCHGEKSKIALQTLQQLSKLYPNDNATGYDVNEVRGAWVVEMNNK